MSRSLLLACFALVSLVPSVRAVEMFTNFHNGENIGFPPMTVPIAVYGHGGWNECEVKQPTRIQGIEPVPAMSPTGHQHCNHVWKNRQAQCVDQAKSDVPSPSPSSTASQDRPVVQTQAVQYVSRRFGGYSGNNYSGNNYSSNNNSGNASYTNENSQPAGDYNASQSPTPAKVAPKNNDSADSREPAAPSDQSKKPISVFARPGTVPESDAAGNRLPSNIKPNEQPPPPSPQTSSRRNTDS